jgi:photosystem II stability/assembly factor-like uncharacterized protein
MGARPLLLVGTKKGVFIGRAVDDDPESTNFSFTGPHCSGTWSFCAVRYDDSTGTIYAGGQSNWYGPAIWRSQDLGQTWDHSSEGLIYADGPSIEQVWSLAVHNGALYAGVDPAGLFRSDDGGRTWTELTSLRAHPTSATWRPTNGGLPLHTILPRAQDGSRVPSESGGSPDALLYAALSSGGAYRSADGGRTWDPAAPAPDACIHALAGSSRAGDPLYQQNHAGIFRSDDAGASWVDVSEGLPSLFGFPLAVHPTDPRTVYAIPLAGAAEGQRVVPESGVAVWRTRDAGATWQPLTNGLPQGRTFLTVLRGGLAALPEQGDSASIFFGTPTGQLFGSADDGDTWSLVARGLPAIYAVSGALV